MEAGNAQIQVNELASIRSQSLGDVGSKYARTKGGPGRKVPKHVAFPNVNRAKLAAKCGVTESCIGKIFYRTTLPGLKLAQRIAKELGLTVEELMGVLEQRPRKRSSKKV